LLAEAFGRDARQLSGTLDRSVNMGAITLPGAESWTWPSRCPTSWIMVVHSVSQSARMLAAVGQRQRATEIAQAV
jgi:hypothetical protein